MRNTRRDIITNRTKNPLFLHEDVPRQKILIYRNDVMRAMEKYLPLQQAIVPSVITLIASVYDEAFKFFDYDHKLR